MEKDFSKLVKDIFQGYDFTDKELLYGIKYHGARICSAIYANKKREGDTTMTFFKGKWKCDNCGYEHDVYRRYCFKCGKNNITIS